MSKGRRLVTTAGIALAVALGVRLVLAQQGTNPPTASPRPARKDTPAGPAQPGGTATAVPVEDLSKPFASAPEVEARSPEQVKAEASKSEPRPVPTPEQGQGTIPKLSPTPASEKTKADPKARLFPDLPRGVATPVPAPASGPPPARTPEVVVPVEDAPGTPPVAAPEARPEPLDPGADRGIDRAAADRRDAALRDEAVIRAQTPAPGGENPLGPAKPAPGGAAPAAAENVGESYFPPAERLPVGPHAVGLTIEVQAPAAANRHKETWARIIVKNSGTTDAMNVVVREALPEGLEFLDSEPAATSKNLPVLIWHLGTLPAGSERVIKLKVKPTQAGVMDHAPTVTMMTGGRARTAVREPKLQIEQRVDRTRALKGTQVRFDVTITNIGDGPARDVVVEAKLTHGLRHEAGGAIELPLREPPLQKPVLGPRESVTINLIADAVAEGDHSCTFVAKSPDVAPGGEARGESVVKVVEPKLVLKLKGPPKRFTNTMATYHLVLENPGSAPAEQVLTAAYLPLGAEVTEIPSGAEWDSKNRRLFWRVGSVEPGKHVDLPFSVRLGGVQMFRVEAKAKANGALEAFETCTTSVTGMSRIQFVLSEPRQVLDVGEATDYVIRIKNYGSKDASNLLITAEFSDQLAAEGTFGPVQGQATPDGRMVKFAAIPRLAANGGELTLTIRAKAVKAGDAICHVILTHDDLAKSRLEHSINTHVTDPNAEPPP